MLLVWNFPQVHVKAREGSQLKPSQHITTHLHVNLNSNAFDDNQRRRVRAGFGPQGGSEPAAGSRKAASAAAAVNHQQGQACKGSKPPEAIFQQFHSKPIQSMFISLFEEAYLGAMCPGPLWKSRGSFFWL